MAQDATLWEDSFQILNLNFTEKYARVGRISGSSTDNLSNMSLDINTDLYPVAVGETVQMVLASTLSLDGSKDDEKGWRDVAKGEQMTLADQYDYVCYGKVYRFEEGKDDPGNM
jgi:DNA-directed RNA polymerase I, II, and III subunit RPABC3